MSKSMPAPLQRAVPRDPSRRLITNQEYARSIGVTSRTLFNYVKRGILSPPTIINGRKFWDPAVLPKGDEAER